MRRMQIRELGHIVLYVTDLERMADFYKNTLGFREILRQRPMALFSGGRTHHELLLIEAGGTPKSLEEAKRVRPGLYHIGFKVGDGPETLRETYRELKEKDVTMIGAADHGVTHSLYILDPDGNELELYADVSDAWRHDPSAILAPPKPLHLDDR